jgi:hypothetical protein
VNAPTPSSSSDARPLRATSGAGDDEPLAQPRLEEFDALVRALLPAIRQISPHLSDVEALRAATRMAEYRIRDEAALFWGHW